ESAPVELRAGQPPLSKGYDYDGINADVLLHVATADDGRLVLSGGMSYRLLVLPPDDPAMSPRLLARIRELVSAGATVVGARPERSPSLEDFPHCDKTVKDLAEEVWGNCDGSRIKEHNFGRGKVVWGEGLGNVLRTAGVLPDFEFHGL